MKVTVTHNYNDRYVLQPSPQSSPHHYLQIHTLPVHTNNNDLQIHTSSLTILSIHQANIRHYATYNTLRYRKPPCQMSGNAETIPYLRHPYNFALAIPPTVCQQLVSATPDDEKQTLTEQ